MCEEDTTDPSHDDRTMVVQLPPGPEGARSRNASLIVLAGSEIGRAYKLTQEEHVFGRSVLVGHRLASPSVSRQHAKIARGRENDADYFELIDLNSSNGTLVNNAPVTRARLSDGDKIQMGDVLFKFVLQDEVDSRFHQDVHRLIHYDQLTGLLTMDAFRLHLEIEMKKTGSVFALAMTDLDGLKRVNDTYGHLAGRLVVREMGAMIRQVLREQDRAGLYGGDEAIVLYPETTLEEAASIAERLRETIAVRVFEFQGNTFGVTISQGLAEWPKHGRTPEDVIAAADAALYAAKAAGRNCVCRAGA